MQKLSIDSMYGITNLLHGIKNDGIKNEGTQYYVEDDLISYFCCPPATNFWIKFCYPEFNEKPQSSDRYLSLVFEIKGAPCTLCAQFGCRVHRF